MISLKNLSKVYELDKNNSVTGVNDINLVIDEGEFIIIKGRSGAGKTTLLNLIAGLTHPSSGQIFWDDIDIINLSDSEISRLRNRRIGFIFQNSSLLPYLSVFENVLLPALFSDNRIDSKVHQRALNLLQTVGMAQKANLFPRQLSTGEQQRITIARSLINTPDLLIADEPTSNLDEKTEVEIIKLFQEIHAGEGISILMVTHIEYELSKTTRNFIMEAGNLTPQEEFLGRYAKS